MSIVQSLQILFWHSGQVAECARHRFDTMSQVGHAHNTIFPHCRGPGYSMRVSTVRHTLQGRHTPI
jgi:hypothetical protein